MRFTNDIQDLIQTDKNSFGTVNGAAAYRYQNIDSAQTYGIESLYQQQLLDFYASIFSYLHSSQNKTTGEKLTQNPST